MLREENRSTLYQKTGLIFVTLWHALAGFVACTN